MKKEKSKKNIEAQFDIYSKSAPIMGLIALILLLFAYFGNFHEGFGDQATFGAFGDFIGGVLNPILSFITVLLLIFSIRFQLQELSYTREEIKKTNVIHSSNVKQQLQLFQATNYLEEITLFHSHIIDLTNKKIMNVRIAKGLPYSGYGAQEGVNYDLFTYSLSELFDQGNRYSDFKNHSESNYIESMLKELSFLHESYNLLLNSLEGSKCDENLYRVKSKMIETIYKKVNKFIIETEVEELQKYISKAQSNGLS